MLLIGAGWWLWERPGSPVPEQAPAAAAPMTEPPPVSVDLYRAALLVTLADPDTAQFRNERLSESGYWCGEYNAQDLNGQYMGYERFAVSPDAVVYRYRSADTLSSVPALRSQVDSYNSGAAQAAQSQTSEADYFDRHVWDVHCRLPGPAVDPKP